MNSQDPGRRYIVGKVVPKGNVYFVEIHRVVSGKPEEKLTTTAEVTRKGGQWQFANFVYPDGHNLLSVLKALKEEREQSAQ